MSSQSPAFSRSPSRLFSGELLSPTPARRNMMEAMIWTLGLLAVAIPDPTQPSVIELCVFKMVGFSGCPGCGLGHAMGYLFRAEWALAFQSHWFSPAVLIILLARIAGLVRHALRTSP